MTEEVRIQMLRPQQLLDRVAKCPVAYIPLGVIEWHGEHNPFGADTLQAEGIAEVCAIKGGGVVFPSLYYGLFQDRMETIDKFRMPILKRMGWDPARFEPSALLDSAFEERQRYVHLLVHMLNEAEAFGFKLAVFVAGHYPLIDHARAAVIEFMDSRKFEDRNTMLAWAFADYLLAEDKYPAPGDHGAGWETSHLMYLHPDTVDLSLLDENDDQLIGVLVGKRSPRYATAEFGREIIDYAVGKALLEVNDRLEYPHLYGNHGRCLIEERWKRPNQPK